MTTVTGENRNAFALMEIIGVLAVLVILAYLLLPRLSKPAKSGVRVENTRQDARVADTLVAIQSLKTAAQGHYSQFGTLGVTSGSSSSSSPSQDQYDTLLLREAFLDRPFAATVGTRCSVRLLNVSGLAANARVNEARGAYDLDGDGQNDVVRDSYVVEAVIFGVSDADAKALNDGLDGAALGPDPQGNDLRGQVIWNGAPPDAPREVHVYITRGR